jgi:hypothetical protein
VQRRQLDELAKAGEDVVVDENRLREARAAVDDAMGDGGDRRRLVERWERSGRVVVVDDAQLQARRAGVDDEDAGLDISQ